MVGSMRWVPSMWISSMVPPDRIDWAKAAERSAALDTTPRAQIIRMTRIDVSCDTRGKTKHFGDEGGPDGHFR